MQLHRTRVYADKLFRTTLISDAFYIIRENGQSIQLEFKLVPLQYKKLTERIDVNCIDQYCDRNTVYANVMGDVMDGFTMLEDMNGKTWFILFQMGNALPTSSVSEMAVSQYYDTISNMMQHTKYNDSFICVFIIHRPYEENITLAKEKRMILITKQDFDVYFSPFFFHNFTMLGKLETRTSNFWFSQPLFGSTTAVQSQLLYNTCQ